MITLTKEQLKFIEYHKIPMSWIFDATGMKKKDYQEIMKKLEKYVAVGVSPCKNNGHTMRTKSGHCLQCNPANLIFELRGSRDAYVYIAGSQNGKLIKVGYTKDPNKREISLNKDKYAGLHDWKILYFAIFPNGGNVENEIHGKLQKYWAKREYNFYGKNIVCYETFNCSYSLVKRIINEIKQQIGNEKIKNECEIKDAESLYLFATITNEEKRIGTINNSEETLGKANNNSIGKTTDYNLNTKANITNIDITHSQSFQENQNIEKEKKKKLEKGKILDAQEQLKENSNKKNIIELNTLISKNQKISIKEIKNKGKNEINIIIVITLMIIIFFTIIIAIIT